MRNRWLRFEHAGEVGFGTLDGDRVHQHQGDMFGASEPTGTVFPLADVKLLTPTEPSKVIALWNNFHEIGDKLNLPVPVEPLYLLKAPNSYLAHDETIRKPLCDGKVVFEGELGIGIGKTCTAVPEANALDHVFGYTCANDVTVADILNRDASSRSRSAESASSATASPRLAPFRSTDDLLPPPPRR